ncbi:hypothetical protein IMCC3317_04350 [Kordia antarctica]|uniref:Uncharacterized protein n=1 Tax=Kordia antarctica TaxID=1218801 RepID=A0A7L4ZF01_9FLAO|nr:hypothetical protein [Kordia antarctica]QHI35089.1 hypothetical protein IMCC3317_04350 [Kordia antarctica]
MKKNITLVFAFILTLSLYAQTPEKLSYQAVLRGVTNTLITNQNVGMQISILQGSASGPAMYVETHMPTTNDNGLVSLEIGTGTVVSGTFNTIDWGIATYFIKTETDPLGGTSYTITGTSQLVSVPYALYARKSGDSKDTFKYLGAARGKNDGSPNPNVNNEIPSFTLVTLRWLGVAENYMNSLGGTNNTQITIPAGVTHIKINTGIIYEAGTADSMSTIAIYQDGTPFVLANQSYPTYNQFNSKYGFNLATQYIPVTPGQVFEFRMFQDSPDTIYLSWGSISASFSFEFYAKN